MAGRLKGGRSLIFGLALAVLGAAAPVSLSHAEPLPEPWAVPKLPHETVFPQITTSPTRIAVVTPETEPATAPAAPVDKKAEDTKRVQRCYAQLGYYKGPIDGKANEQTWTAHWYFKNEHGLKRYGDFLAEPVLKKVKELCKEEEPVPEPEPEPVSEPESQPESEPDPVEAAAPEPAEPSEVEPDKIKAAEAAEETKEVKEAEAAEETKDTGETAEESETALAPEELAVPVVEEELPPPPTRLDIDCLDGDLIALLRKAHGASVRARTCLPGCLPPPKGLSQIQLDDLRSRYGVAWCLSCLQIAGHLSLDDIKRIEDEGDIELCTIPPRQLPRPGMGNGNVVKSFSRIRELYRALPPASEDPGKIAVIIGNGNYDNLPAAETARNDAGAMYFFLTEHLGFRQDRIIDLRNAKRADFERVFGPVPGSDGELKRLVGAQPNAKVVVYYSGHGATNSSHSETYLLPVDAEPYREERGGYPLSTLYANLAALKAKSVLVLLESSFGRDHGAYVLPPNLPETTTSALPPQPLSTVTVLASADRGQRALIDTSYDIGLFTRYLIEGLAGSADLYPVGNGDGRVDSAEIYAYAAAMVRLSARKTFGLLQEPVYSSAMTPMLTDPGEVAAKPN
jgi:caspase domain-containing protein